MVIFICKLLSRPPCCWPGYHQFLHCWCPRPHSLALCCHLIFSLCYLDFLLGVPWSGGVVSFLNLLFWCLVGAIVVKVFKECLARGIFLDSHILVIYICFPLISCLSCWLNCFTMSLGWCCPVRPCPWSGLHCQLLFGQDSAWALVSTFGTLDSWFVMFLWVSCSVNHFSMDNNMVAKVSIVKGPPEGSPAFEVPGMLWVVRRNGIIEYGTVWKPYRTSSFGPWVGKPLRVGSIGIDKSEGGTAVRGKVIFLAVWNMKLSKLQSSL